MIGLGQCWILVVGAIVGPFRFNICVYVFGSFSLGWTLYPGLVDPLIIIINGKKKVKEIPQDTRDAITNYCLTFLLGMSKIHVTLMKTWAFIRTRTPKYC